jgi:hypothetical protein
MPKYEAFINLFVLYDYFLPSIPIFILLVFFSKFSHNLRYLNLLFYLFMYYFIIFSYTNFRAYKSYPLNRNLVLEICKEMDVYSYCLNTYAQTKISA